MKDLKTAKTINKLQNLLLRETQNDDEEFFFKHIEIEIAKSLLQDFGDITAMRIGKILLGACESNNIIDSTI